MEKRNGDKNKNEGFDRISAVITKEKEAARARFGAAGFRARLESRLEAERSAIRHGSGRSKPSRANTLSPFRFLLARPLAAASLAAGFMAVLAALWFFVVSPALRPPTLERHIYEVLLRSAPRERLATETGAATHGPRVFPAPAFVPEHEIPIVLYRILENLSTIRPASEFPPVEEERASPTEDRLYFEELLKRIKEV